MSHNTVLVIHFLTDGIVSRAKKIKINFNTFWHSTFPQRYKKNFFFFDFVARKSLQNYGLMDIRGLFEKNPSLKTKWIMDASIDSAFF